MSQARPSARAMRTTRKKSTRTMCYSARTSLSGLSGRKSRLRLAQDRHGIGLDRSRGIQCIEPRLRGFTPVFRLGCGGAGQFFPRFIRGFEIVVRKGVLDPRDEALNAGSFGITDAADAQQTFGIAGQTVEETFIRAGLLGGLARDNAWNESRKSRSQLRFARYG